MEPGPANNGSAGAAANAIDAATAVGGQPTRGIRRTERTYLN